MGHRFYQGAMFLLAYFEDGTPVMGLPGCVDVCESDSV